MHEFWRKNTFSYRTPPLSHSNILKYKIDQYGLRINRKKLFVAISINMRILDDSPKYADHQVLKFKW